MLGRHTKALSIALLLVIKVAVWTWLLYTIGAEELVSYIGVENGYLVMFLVALLGGLSTFTSVTYFATVYTLAAAGLDPLGLAIASSSGVSIGDVIFYYIGYFGIREVVSGKLNRIITSASTWLQKRPKPLLFIFVYAYAGFTPLPNDVLAIMLGTTKQPLRLVLPALVLGNATLIFMLVTLSRLGS